MTAFKMNRNVKSRVVNTRLYFKCAKVCIRSETVGFAVLTLHLPELPDKALLVHSSSIRAGSPLPFMACSATSTG